MQFSADFLTFSRKVSEKKKRIFQKIIKNAQKEKMLLEYASNVDNIFTMYTKLDYIFF